MRLFEYRFLHAAAVAGVSISALLISAGPAVADCQPEWDNALGAITLEGWVEAMSTFSDSTGDYLIVGGPFGQIAGVPGNGIARYNKMTGEWSGMAGGTTGWVEAIAVWDDGTREDPTLYIAGNFAFAGGNQVSHNARWNGFFWEALGSFPNQGVSARVRDLAVIPEGPGAGVYVGGEFTQAGGISANYVARWDGSQWHALGSGTNNVVRALAVWDDGTGPALYAGGYFTTAGGVSASGVARWDPVIGTWSALGAGTSAGGSPFPAGPRAIVPYNGELIVGGNMPMAGGMTVNHIARWNGSQWLAMTGGGVGGGGSALLPTILAMDVFDDGDGEELYVGGLFTEAGGVPVERIAKWNQSGWSPLGFPGAGVGPVNGNTPSVRAFATRLDGVTNVLDMGGSFQEAGGLPAAGLATWRGCVTETIPGDLTGDGSVGVADLLILINAWGACPDCGDCPADLNGDCTVGVPDLLILINNWG